jgi:hypothetical protein
VAILAAGLHGPATAAAVKLLAQPGAFAERPLGGVFRVHVPNNAPWEERYHHLNPVWDTHPYTLEEYEASLDKFVGDAKNDLTGSLRFWEPDKVRTLLSLLKAQRTASA